MWNPKTDENRNIRNSRQNKEKTELMSCFKNRPTGKQKTQKETKSKREEILKKSNGDVKVLPHAKEQKIASREGVEASSRISDIEAANLVHMDKTRNCLKKISQYLDYLLEISEFPPEMEDINDLLRRQKRSSEFSCRFGRNHLYQIGKMVKFCHHTNPVNFTYRLQFSFFSLFFHFLQKNIEQRERNYV